jgi:hypothetical protein
MSEIEGLDRSLEGLPINLEGHFEVREDENPVSPVRWIFKAHHAYQEAGACNQPHPQTNSDESVEGAADRGTKP